MRVATLEATPIIQEILQDSFNKPFLTVGEVQTIKNRLSSISCLYEFNRNEFPHLSLLLLRFYCSDGLFQLFNDENIDLVKILIKYIKLTKTISNPNNLCELLLKMFNQGVLICEKMFRYLKTILEDSDFPIKLATILESLMFEQEQQEKRFVSLVTRISTCLKAEDRMIIIDAITRLPKSVFKTLTDGHEFFLQFSSTPLFIVSDTGFDYIWNDKIPSSKIVDREVEYLTCLKYIIQEFPNWVENVYSNFKNYVNKNSVPNHIIEKFIIKLLHVTYQTSHDLNIKSDLIFEHLKFAKTLKNEKKITSSSTDLLLPYQDVMEYLKTSHQQEWNELDKEGSILPFKKIENLSDGLDNETPQSRIFDDCNDSQSNHSEKLEMNNENQLYEEYTQESNVNIKKSYFKERHIESVDDSIVKQHSDDSIVDRKQTEKTETFNTHNHQERVAEKIELTKSQVNTTTTPKKQQTSERYQRIICFDPADFPEIATSPTQTNQQSISKSTFSNGQNGQFFPTPETKTEPKSEPKYSSTLETKSETKTPQSEPKFSSTSSAPIIQKRRGKVSTTCVPFKFKFNFKYFVKNIAFTELIDVKISHNHNSIIIGNRDDIGVYALMFFNLSDRQFNKMVKLDHSISSFVVDKDSEGLFGLDSLIIISEGTIYKYDIQNLITTSKSVHEWKVQIPNITEYNVKKPSLSSVTVFYDEDYEKNLIITCDSSRQCLYFHDYRGKEKKSIGNSSILNTQTLNLQNPLLVDVNLKKGSILLAENQHIKYILDDEYDISEDLIVNQVRNVSGLAVDQCTGNFLVSDLDGSFTVYNDDGSKKLKQFSDRRYSKPARMCINEKTGELFVIFDVNKIVVFE